MKRCLHTIRQSDEKTRFRWLIGLSVTATLIVVIVWVLYMRAFVFTNTRENSTEEVRIGFWPVLKNGLTITGSSIGRGFETMLSGMPQFGRRTSTIQNPD